MIKKTRILLFFAVVVLGQALGVTPVRAEAAHCFMKSLVRDAAFYETSCADYASVIAFATGTSGPQDDQCYTISGSVGTVIPSVEAKPLSSDTCKKWLADAGATASTPTKCVAIDGSMSDWNDGKIKDISKYNINANCADYYGKLTTNGGGDASTFKNGQCYLIFTAKDGKFDYFQTECNQGLESLIVHQQIATGDQGIVDPGREKVIHCGENGETPEECFKSNPLIANLNNIISFVSVGIGLIVVIMVVVGGIQYVAAGNNPQAVSAAKKRITNAILALVAFMLLFAFLQWLIPGGPL